MSVEATSRVLAFLIADIRGYTSYTRTRGDEAAARLAGTFAEIAREGVEAHGGDVIELRGDEALAVFGSAQAALQAAVGLQLVFADEIELHPGLPLRVGIGLDAGAAVPVQGGYRGGALNLAARLCSKAGPGEVFASQGVLLQAGAVEGIAVHDHGVFEMKGLDEPVRVSRVGPADLDPDELVARFEPNGRASPTRAEVPRALDTATPLVGRDREIHRLRWAWRRARRHGGATMFVLGPPGIGKTRLLAELATSAAHDGATISYMNFREPRDRGIEAELADLATPALLVLDDLEQGPEASDVVDLLAGWVPENNALLVAAVDDSALSPELRALVQRAGDAVVRPGPLGLDDVRQIAGLYLGEAADDLPASLLESTGGVPRRVHMQVSDWAYAEATRRLGVAASRAAAGRSGLRSAESELAGNVEDLQLIRERARLYTTGDGQATVETTESPFKGLAAFEVDDADLFFGRERFVAELVARLAGASLLGVVGPSGSGKSSAVRAGLIPAIRSGTLPGSDGWIVALMRPGEHPMRELDRALRAALPAPLPAGTDASLRAARDALGADGRALVVIDQFEEVFTACADESERSVFFAALTEAANDVAARVTVVVVVRADFYGRCAEDPALAELLGSNHVLAGPLSADEYRRAIEQPALRVGVHVEPALTEALVAEVGDEPGALPLLSTALLELWERRDGRAIRLDAYIETGGVRGAVSRLAEEVYGGFTGDQQAVARAVMLRLAGPGDGDTVVRRRVPLAEFDADRNEDVARVVSVLTDRRLLTVSEGVVEVAHEALLREWPRVRDWLEEDRAGRVLHAHLIGTARGWAGAERDPSELYRGARLASALDWTTEHTLELNELEREFLTASRDANEREAYRQRRTNRRLRGLLVGVAVFLVVALIAGGLALVQRGRATRSAEVADAQRLGAQAVVEDELDTSLLLAREAVRIDDSVNTRSTLLATLLKAPGAISVLPGTGDRVLEIYASADGSVLATSDNIGGIAIYDTAALQLMRIVHVSNEGGPIAISPDGSTIVQVTFGQDGVALTFISTADGSVRSVPLPEGTGFVQGHPLTYTPDGAEIVSIEMRPEAPTPLLVRRDASIGEEIDSHPLSVANPGVIEISADGSSIAIGSMGPYKVTVLDAETLQRTAIDTSGVAFDISPDGGTIALGQEDGTVVLVDSASGERAEMDGRHAAAVQGVGFSPDGSTLVTTGDDRDVLVWDLETGSLNEILHGHAGKPFGPAFDATGDTAFTAGLDGRVIAWDLTSERRIGDRFEYADPSTFNLDADLLTAGAPDGSLFAFSPGNGRVIVQSPDASEASWDADPWTDEQFATIQEQAGDFGAFDTGLVTSLAFSPDGAVLAVSGQHGEVLTYEASTGRELARWTASEIAWVNSLAFAPDGTLVTANDDGRIASWDPTTGGLRNEIRVTPPASDPDAFTGGVWRAVPSPDGSTLAVVTYEVGAGQELMALDAETGDVRWDGAGADLWNTVVAWSPDARFIATGGWQTGKLNMWNAATGRRVAEPAQATAGWVLSIDFAWGGSLVVTGATDGTIRLFDTETLKQVGANIPADDNLWALADVMPGDEMLILSNSGHAWRWDLNPARWARHACVVANRSLTVSEWRAFLPDREYAPAC